MAARTRSSRSRVQLALATLVFALAPLAGCAGDPDIDIDGAPQALIVADAVARPTWQAAPAGCEGLSSEGLTIARCEGAPLLGALVDARGMVRCVDAIALLRVETLSFRPITPLAGDPSPQPNRPQPIRPPPPELAR